MARYRVDMFCNECFQTHPMGIEVELADGPADQATIGDTYAGRELPPEVVTLRNNRIMCPNTFKLAAQPSNSEVFLVPIG